MELNQIQGVPPQPNISRHNCLLNHLLPYIDKHFCGKKCSCPFFVLKLSSLAIFFILSNFVICVHKWSHLIGGGGSKKWAKVMAERIFCQQWIKSDGGGARFGLISNQKAMSFMDGPQLHFWLFLLLSSTQKWVSTALRNFRFS